MKLRIAHFGSYNINLGDNIALYNIRKSLGEHLEIEWANIDIATFHKKNNDESFCVNTFKHISDNHDVLIIGGGGLIEGETNRGFSNGWKLPLSHNVLKVIKIPIICHSLGFNYFYGRPKLKEANAAILRSIIERSMACSFRNDGSYQIALDLYPECEHQIDITPDPGLIIDQPVDRRSELNIGYFQPAFNSSREANLSRSMTDQNIKKLMLLIQKHNLYAIPHTIKDYLIENYGVDLIIGTKEFKSNVHFNHFHSILNLYRNCDYILAMRGHGQLITFGMNIPGIYFSTQPKVYDFAQHSDMIDYVVDVRESDWLSKLNNLLNNLTTDIDYLNNWYNIRDTQMSTFKIWWDSFNQKVVNALKVV